MNNSSKDGNETTIFSDMEEENGEMIPLFSLDDDNEEKNIKDEDIKELPVLPLKNTVLYPGVVIPVTVGREKSVKLVKKSYKGNRKIGVLAQEDAEIEDPSKEDLYRIGTVAYILKMLSLPDGNTTIIIQGRQRFEVEEYISEEPYLKAKIDILKENFPEGRKKQTQALMASLKDAASKILDLNPDIPREAQVAVDNIDDPEFLTNFLCSNVNADVKDKQKLLELNKGKERATLLLELLHKDIQLLELKREIHDKVHVDINEQQRDYYLRQQLKVLQEELGDSSGGFPNADIDNLRVKAKNKKWDNKVLEFFNKEMEKIKRMNPASPEYPLTLNHLETLVDLPWNEFTEDELNLAKSQKILDKEHFGLEDVKDRIIEYLAVLKLKNDMKSPILCLYGPPGVGKTSLGKSIAKALNREYARIALGGLHDEAEIRGHRKTYIGAMPGKIIQSLKKVKSSNPVFILDEIDKVGSNLRGDPASALLEVLDPEQNHSFIDNYLEVEYDLSNVLFIATANSLDSIHPALRDRMEIIEINSYTLEEKVQIAKKHLIPEQRKAHGLKAKDISFLDKTIAGIIDGYTREAGVRNLKRELGKVCRKVAKAIALEESYKKSIALENLKKLLGQKKFEKEVYQEFKVPGIVTGLAWTRVGGEILYIETSLSRGKGKLILSGQLGDVMKESASTALSYLKAIAYTLDIDYDLFDKYDLHIHVPAGAVPKDGPSAGIAMFTSLASLFSKRKVKGNLAMTGEITLSGRVLPVGGIKEKILAAKRAGIKNIILCKKNEKDIKDINQDYLKGLDISYVEVGEEVLDLALERKIVENPALVMS